jgi:hypothetical protein
VNSSTEKNVLPQLGNFQWPIKRSESLSLIFKGGFKEAHQLMFYIGLTGFSVDENFTNGDGFF